MGPKRTSKATTTKRSTRVKKLSLKVVAIVAMLSKVLKASKTMPKTP